jgi:hypothetical protein
VAAYFAHVEKRVRAAELAEAQAHAASAVMAALGARDSNSEGERPNQADVCPTGLAALEQLLARAGIAPVGDQVALYRAAAADTLRQHSANVFARDVLRKALVESAGLEDAYHASWMLRGALDEVRGLLAFRPLMEAARIEGWPDFTPIGELQLKRYPVHRLARLWTARNPDKAFWMLHNHIKRHNIPMTAPVEMTLESLDGEVDRPVAMAFLYPSDRAGQPGLDGEIEVEDVSAGTTVSIGLLGEPPGRWLGQARAALAEWLQQRAGDYEAAGPPRLLIYNSPMVPPGRRYAEFQIPVQRKGAVV